MRRYIGAVSATLTAVGLILAGPALPGRAATAQTSQANAALRYLYSQVGGDGSVASSFGPGATEDTVISVADNGYDPATLKSASTGTTTYSYLAGQASAITTAGGAAKYVLTWVAAGRPAAFDGAAVLAKLNAPTPAGYLNANGTFHNATTETATAYNQSLGVLADLAANHVLPANATGWLTCAQRGDGGFGTVIHDSAAAPPGTCGDTASDTNATAIVLQALAGAGITSADSAAKSYLHSVQAADGGFPFNAGSGSDPDSDGTVTQALVAIGEDPTGSSWSVGGRDALANLETFADAHSGGYIFPGNTTADAFTTSTIPQALALKPYASTTTIVLGSSPPPATAGTPSPAATARAITVPDTGGAEPLGGGPAWGVGFLLAGTLALTCLASRGSGSSPP